MDETAGFRRWVTLAIIVSSMLIAALDTTVLNVAIPTILHDFHTELPSLQWVITGYSLTFATFLIVGGRLGDVFGARRMFMLGVGLFGVGSLLASVATSVPTLLLGESLIEGMGAAMMMPATLAILSGIFVGRDRATAFAVWGATAGIGVAFGPVLGGFLTTHYSWRWSFRINVIVAPLAILGALLFVPRTPPADRRQRIDVPGAVLVALGTFLLVFGLSEGERYGWVTPHLPLTVQGWTVWPAERPISAVPVAFAAAFVFLVLFQRVERRKEATDADPLFALSQLRHRGFRYGLLTTAVLAMGQVGFLYVLSVFLQESKGLSAAENGWWFVPSGVFIILGAQVGGRLARVWNTTVVVRCGLLLEAIGLISVAIAIRPEITLASLLPGFLAFGVGLGFASSQLTNVSLAEIDADKVGAASGASATVRQIGAALGISIIGTVLTSRPSVAVGARSALLLGGGIVGVGALLSLLIPLVTDPSAAPDIPLEAFETTDPVAALDAL